VTGSRFLSARLVVAVCCLALVAVACGDGDKSSTGTTSSNETVPASPGTTSSGPKAAARWETVVTLSGTGSTTTAPFDILPNAIQWRARWTCESGTLKAETDPPPRRPATFIDARCPLEGEGFSIVTGPVKLAITATGPWKVIVDQQIDTPLNEPPLPAMATGRVLSSGNFYNVEKEGTGTARLYQLADGKRALRIEDLNVNQNTDLFVWLDSAVNPKTSKDAVSSEYWVLSNLKSTVGSQNYEIPANIPIDRVRSVVIWCQPVAIAYAAAALSS
jgi:hypothetical protein